MSDGPTHEEASPLPSGGVPDTDPLASSGVRDGLPGPDDPEAIRVRTLLASRLLGEPSTAARIGRFILLERVAEGGMGVVFAAYDDELDRKVAVKVIRGDIVDPSVRRRIVREAQAMAKLSHPNVAQVFEVGEDRDRTFIAMEFVRGETLRRWHARPGRSCREIVAMYVQAARGLAAAHAAELVHRDFKPDNAIVGADGRVRVLDFGLARAETLDGDAPRPEASAPRDDALAAPLTRSGSVLGTPAYMAPEQFLGERVDARADQFSFCVALWEALHGERPFAGSTHAELIANVIAGRMRQPPSSSKVPAWIRGVLLRGLSVTAADRHADVEALVRALEDDPSRRRRRYVAATAAFGVVVLAVGAYALVRARQLQACEDDAATIAEVWNDSVRERAHASMLASGLALAPTTWERVEPRLDADAARWSELRARSCTDAVRGTVTAEVATSMRQCLDVNREVFAGFVESLTTADTATVLGAVRGATALPRVEQCEDVTRSRQILAPEDLPSRERVASLRRRLGRVRALEIAGRNGEALALARELESEAEALEWPPVHAEALLALGQQLAIASDELPEAERVLEQAVEAGLQSGNDVVVIDAARQLATSVGYVLGRHERGLWWGSLGLMLVRRSGNDEDVRTAALQHAIALIHEEQGDHESARQMHEQALATREQLLGDDHPDVATSLVDLATVHLSEGDYAGAKAVLERSLALRERIFGADHPTFATSLDALASVHDFAGEPHEARTLFARALSIREPALGSDHPDVALTLDGLARTYADTGDLDRARELFERSLATSERSLGPDHVNVATTLHFTAFVYSRSGEHDRARAAAERALAIFAKIHGSEHVRTAAAEESLAGILETRGDHDEAWVHSQRAVATFERVLGPDHPQLATPLALHGEIAVSRGRAAEALPFAERAVALGERLNLPAVQVANMRFTLAQALWESHGDRARAVELARRARDAYAEASSEMRAIAEAWLAEHRID